jgi:hypothetical protein
VSVTAAGATTFTVTAVSPGNHHFVVHQAADGTQTRSCDAGLVPDGGGCSNGSW